MSDAIDDLEAAAGLSVFGAGQVPGAEDTRAALVAAGVPSLIVAKDPSLWGADAQAEAAVRLGWVDTIRRSRALLPRLAEIRAELAGLDHVVLAGMGGSSLAPEVICRTLGKPLTVLDTTDPHQIRTALGDRLDRTVVVVSSKSGSTVETDSHRRTYLKAFADAGLSTSDAGKRFVVVTDPGSPLAATAAEMGAHLILADPDVGGRYSALTAFGLVPSALAGVDVSELIDQAEELFATLGTAKDNPALGLGVALGLSGTSGRDKIALVPDGTGIVGLGDWAEQLIAESTGKKGKGLLPVVVENPSAPGATGSDVLTVTLGGSLGALGMPGGGIAPDISVNGPLGAQFLAWEFATAIAGRILGIDPFDQPNVAESKDNTKRILDDGPPDVAATFTDGPIIGYGGTASDVAGALRELLDGIAPTGYLAVMAYLDRIGEPEMADIRGLLASASGGRPVTYGWGPRFLHSTGQYHKGGPRVGSYLQITGVVTEDLAVPDQAYTFGVLQAAQAAGDREALGGRGRPLLRLHLTDREAGIEALLAAARGLASGGSR